MRTTYKLFISNQLSPPKKAGNFSITHSCNLPFPKISTANLHFAWYPSVVTLRAELHPVCQLDGPEATAVYGKWLQDNDIEKVKVYIITNLYVVSILHLQHDLLLTISITNDSFWKVMSSACLRVYNVAMCCFCSDPTTSTSKSSIFESKQTIWEFHIASHEWGLKKNKQPSFWIQRKQSIFVISNSMCLQMKTKEATQKGPDSKQPVSTTCFAPRYKTTRPSSKSLTAVSNWQKIKKHMKTMQPSYKWCNTKNF